MSLVEHTRRELELAGQFKQDPAYAQTLVAAVAAFASYGHSGDSAQEALRQLTTLLRYEPLTPLTDDPGEWRRVPDAQCADGQAPLWQNIRDSRAFSNDRGRSYWLVDEVDAVRQEAADAAPKPMHTSVAHLRYGDAGQMRMDFEAPPPATWSFAGPASSPVEFRPTVAVPADTARPTTCPGGC